PGPDRLAESADLRRRMHAALESLSPLERAAFTLRHHEGHTIDDIRRTLGLGTSAAKHAVFRAVKKLRVELNVYRDHADRGRGTKDSRDQGRGTKDGKDQQCDI